MVVSFLGFQLDFGSMNGSKPPDSPPIVFLSQLLMEFEAERGNAFWNCP